MTLKNSLKTTGTILLLSIAALSFTELLCRLAIFPKNLLFEVREITHIQKTYRNGIKNLVPDQIVYATDESTGTANKSIIKYRINHLGYRGEDFPREKKQNELRAVILGGSHIFDINAYVSDGLDGFNQVARDSFRLKGINFNFINAGVPGQDIKNILMRLSDDIPELKPDIVIINSTYNDLRWIPANDTVLMMEKVFGESGKSFLNPFSEKLGINPMDNRYSKTDVWLGWSNLYRRIRDIVWLARERLWQKKIKDYISEQITQNNENLGFNHYAALLAKAIIRIRKMDAIPVLCIEERLMAPNPDIEMLNVHSPGWFPYSHSYETVVNDYLKADTIIRAVSKANHATLFDINQYIGGKKEFFSDDIHTSKSGSREMGKWYYRLLLPLALDSIKQQ